MIRHCCDPLKNKCDLSVVHNSKTYAKCTLFWEFGMSGISKTSPTAFHIPLRVCATTWSFWASCFATWSDCASFARTVCLSGHAYPLATFMLHIRRGFTYVLVISVGLELFPASDIYRKMSFGIWLILHIPTRATRTGLCII